MHRYFDDHTLSRLSVGELQSLLQTLQREISALPEASDSRAIAFANAQRLRRAIANKQRPPMASR